MSSVIEDRDSRFPVDFGKLGLQPVPRRFIIEVDEVDDDPYALISDGSSAVGGVYLGSRHPWQRSLTCMRHTIDERKGKKTYIGHAWYHPRLVPEPTGAWSVDLASSNEAFTLLREVSGERKIIGPPIYATSDRDSLTIPGYTDPFEREPTHYVPLNVPNTKLHLWQTAMRKPEGIPSTWPTMVFHFFKQIPYYDFASARWIAKFRQTTNLDKLYVNNRLTAYPRELRLDDCRITRRAGQMDGSTSGVIWDVDLWMTWKERYRELDRTQLGNVMRWTGGWTPHEAYHTYIDEEGNEAEVLSVEADRPVRDEFEIMHLAYYDRMLKMFG